MMGYVNGLVGSYKIKTMAQKWSKHEETSDEELVLETDNLFITRKIVEIPVSSEEETKAESEPEDEERPPLLKFKLVSHWKE